MMGSREKLPMRELNPRRREDGGGRTEDGGEERKIKKAKSKQKKMATRRPKAEGSRMTATTIEDNIYEPQAPLVADFLSRALLRDNPIKALLAEFRAVKRPMTKEDFSKMVAFTANPTRNRYKDVGCTENNRVVLTMGDQPYIHANYAGTPSDPRKFICTQAPIDSTVADFWTMIVQEGSRCILMLCNYFEGLPKKVPKCAQYMPKVGDEKTYGLVTVRNRKAEKVRFRDKSQVTVVRMELEISWAQGDDTSTRKRLLVDHLHWLDWPDRGVPPADSGPIELIQYLQSFRGHPIVVHCSAGIGRTGCIVLMDQLLERVLTKQPWPADLFTLIHEIRRSRHNSIQTEQQFLYCHMALINFLQREGCLTPDMQAVLPGWIEEYELECKPHKG